MTTPAQSIVARIDHRIDQLRDTLRARQARRGDIIIEDSAASWQLAWDTHPDLMYEEKGLFLARCIAHEFEDAGC